MARTRYLFFSAACAGATVLAWNFADKPVALFIAQRATPAYLATVQAISWWGNSVIYLLGSAVVFLFARRAGDTGVMRRAGQVLCAVAVGGLVSHTLKALLGRARPGFFFSGQALGFQWLEFEADFWSMPSGHTTTSMAVAVILSAGLPKYRWAILTAGLALASTRILITAHFVSDVIAGIWVGTSAALVVLRWSERNAHLPGPKAGHANHE